MNSITRLIALALSAALFLETPVLACGMGAIFPAQEPLLALKAGDKVYHRVAAKWDKTSLAIVKLIPGPKGAKTGATDKDEKLDASFDMMEKAVKPELIERFRSRGLGPVTRGMGAPKLNESTTLLSSGATARVVEVPFGTTFAQLRENPAILKLKADGKRALNKVSIWQDEDIENWMLTVQTSGRSIYAAIIEVPAEKVGDPEFTDKLKKASVYITYPAGNECEIHRDAVLEAMGNPTLNVAYGNLSAPAGARIMPGFHAAGGVNAVTVTQTQSQKGDPMVSAEATGGIQAKAWQNFLLISFPRGRMDPKPIPACAEFASR